MSRPLFQVKHEYIGNNGSSEFAFDFKITKLEHLLIVVLDANGVEIYRLRGNDTSYIDHVTFDEVNGGGKVYLKAALPGLHRIAIVLSDDSPIQNYEFRNKTSFTLRRFEDALDLLGGAIQSLAFKFKRSMRVHELDADSFNTVFPPGAAEAAGRVLQVDDSGTGMKYGPLAKDIYNDKFGGVFAGYSARFSENVDVEGVRDAILDIYDFSYAPPLVSLSASGSGTIREKGTVVTNAALSASVTKRSDLINGIVFKKDGAIIFNDTPADITGSGTTNYNWNGTFSDNTSFSVEVTDASLTTVNSNAVYSFVYPYYYGVGASGLNAAGIVAALTKAVIPSTASVAVTTSPSSQHFYFCYPTVYPALTSILDKNGFETLPAYTVRSVTITGLDGTPQSYRVYELTVPTTQVAFTNTYKR